MSRYDTYFLRPSSQVGGSIRHIGDTYAHNVHLMKGRGLGSVFSTLFKFISPYIGKVTKAVGKEALRGGMEIFKDLGTDSMTNLLKKQGMKSAENLASKASEKLKRMRENQEGGVIKRRKLLNNPLIPHFGQLAIRPLTSGKIVKKKSVKPKKKKTSVKKRKSHSVGKTFLQTIFPKK
jgi:hypothetical protein